MADRAGINEEFSDEEMEHGDIEWDFAAADEYGRTIIGWD